MLNHYRQMYADPASRLAGLPRDITETTIAQQLLTNGPAPRQPLTALPRGSCQWLPVALPAMERSAVRCVRSFVRDRQGTLYQVTERGQGAGELEQIVDGKSTVIAQIDSYSHLLIRADGEVAWYARPTPFLCRAGLTTVADLPDLGDSYSPEKTGRWNFFSADKQRLTQAHDQPNGENVYLRFPDGTLLTHCADICTYEGVEYFVTAEHDRRRPRSVVIAAYRDNERVLSETLILPGVVFPHVREVFTDATQLIIVCSGSEPGTNAVHILTVQLSEFFTMTALSPQIVTMRHALLERAVRDGTDILFYLERGVPAMGWYKLGAV